MFRLCGTRGYRWRILPLILVAIVIFALYDASILFTSSKELSKHGNFDLLRNHFNLVRANKDFRLLKPFPNNNIYSINSNFIPALAKPKSYKPFGLGEFGIAVVQTNLSKINLEEKKRFLKQFGVNHFLSENISLHRTLKDPRPPS